MYSSVSGNRQKMCNITNIEPDVMSFLRRRSELHFSLWCRDDDTVLMKTRRHGVGVEDIPYSIDISC